MIMGCQGIVAAKEACMEKLAALKIASYLPLPYSALSVLLVIPTPLRDAVYDHVAKNRYKWFGKEDDCIVLEKAEMMRRFIDRDEMMRKGKDSF
ncbi:hypothetical protein QJS04_geneDACA013261 [Acorus gramineus]|uniref:Uncharacterized protein n=1 Tax=Acorus gramineus TaxID=55184 RepID=A0AAV9B889_ACOGR|nr:hypothetical protein QJS04_geneDACA013261 [Acorus gramineus]